MSQTSGKRVTGSGSAEIIVPSPLMVRFRCGKCAGEEVLDVYRGAPQHCGRVMEGVAVVRSEPAYGMQPGESTRVGGQG